MKKIISFEEFIKHGTVRKQAPNRERSAFLIKESEQDYKYLLELIKVMGVKDMNSNDYIKRCYDIIMQLTRAKMLIKGFNSSGHRAHEAEVSYLSKIGFRDSEVNFINQMRFFRNGMLYYGTMLDKEYANKVIKFTKEIYLKLKDTLEVS